jgi:Tfp pilus assembly protein PilX
MNNSQNKLHRAPENGIAMLTALFALLILSALAVAMMYMATTDTQINANYKDSEQSYWGARAGLEEVRARLMTVGGDLLPSAPTALPPNANSVLYVVNPNNTDPAIQPWNTQNAYYDTTLCPAFWSQMLQAQTCTPVTFTTANGINTGTQNSINPFVSQANALPYKWVRVTLKANNSSGFLVQAAGDPVPNNTTPICWDGQQQLIKPAYYSPKCDSTPSTALGAPNSAPLLTPVYILTAYAISPQGSTRFAQMEIANNPPFVTNAAVDSIDNVVLNGSLTVDGYDNCNCSCSMTGSGNNQVYTCVDRLGYTCDRSKYAIYAAGTVQNPGPSEQITSGASPGPISAGNGSAFPYDISALINTYKNGAQDVTKACPVPQTSPVTSPCGWTCTNGACGTQSGATAGVPPTMPPSPPAAPVGPPDMSTQITYVPGNVQLTGNAQGNGILIVDGDLDIHGGLNFYGLILVKGDIKFTGGGSNAVNVYGAVLAGQESYVDNTLGGSASIHFDSCALKHNLIATPPRMMAFRELTF